jgi:hypothetical protein
MLMMFICAHCPFVIHLEKALAQLGRDYAGSTLGILAVSSNSVESHPQDGPEHLKAQAETHGFTFPYLYDQTQEVAKAYTAACTPDFFLFDASHRLVYRGQFDESRPNSGHPVTGQDLREALDAVLAGKTPDPDTQQPSLGCNIKWIPGNEPPYFQS